MKRPGGEKEEVVLRHTESKRMRLEEEVKPIEPKEVSPSTKVESSLLEEKKDYELPCEEVKKKKEKESESKSKSSIVITSSSEQNVDSPYGKRFFDFFNFLWCRGNKKENAKKTLGNSNSTGIYSLEAAVKEESYTNRNEDTL